MTTQLQSRRLTDSVITVEQLVVHFKTKKRGLFVHAVDGVTVELREREALGVVGESGSGKTTLGKAVMKLVKPTSGTISFNGRSISEMSKEELRQFRRNVQMVFQDPFDSIDPRFSVYQAVGEGIEILHLASTKAEADELVAKALEFVRLSPARDYFERRILSLSGGQRQRVAVARALAVDPSVMILDEPVSMLDASVRGEIVKLMESLKAQGKTFMMITHDIATLKFFADRVAVMYLGKVMEVGGAREIVSQPLHPYTQALVAAVPVPDPSQKVRSLAKGEIANAVNPPSGCRFHPRCPLAQEICTREEPLLRVISSGRMAACHFV